MTEWKWKQENLSIFNLLAAGIGLRILLGRQSYLAAVFCGVGIWVNVILYSVYTDSVLDVLGSVAAVVVLLSLFDVIEIHYISMAATILFVILNIFVLHKVEFSGALSVLECIMQFLAIFILELMDTKRPDKKKQGACNYHERTGRSETCKR